MKRFLAINPGSTSTKIALYQGDDSWSLSEVATAELSISREDATRMPEPNDQTAFRAGQIDAFLKEAGSPELHAVVGRGGITRPIDAGSYAINQTMLDDFSGNRYGTHASNLGALLAKAIADSRGIPALIADPVGVDQFEPLARYSGWPALERKSQLHALNMRSVAREACRTLGGELVDFNLVIAHLGGGISIGPMKKGRLVDVNNAMDGGPFSPQRTGGLSWPCGTCVQRAVPYSQIDDRRIHPQRRHAGLPGYRRRPRSHCQNRGWRQKGGGNLPRDGLPDFKGNWCDGNSARGQG